MRYSVIIGAGAAVSIIIFLYRRLQASERKEQVWPLGFIRSAHTNPSPDDSNALSLALSSRLFSSSFGVSNILLAQLFVAPARKCLVDAVPS
jgi:hypothetical protein